MKALRHHAIRLASALVLAALVLVPLLERGHSHADRDLARPCAVCVAAHHSPAAATVVVAVAVPVAQPGVAGATPVACPARRTHSPQRGRAPPPSRSTSV